MKWEHENAYFKVSMLAKQAETDVISFSISEEVGKTDEMSLTLRDPYNLYSRELKFGTRVIIEWGTFGLYGVRRENKGIVTSANGNANDNGVITTTINIQSIIEIKTNVFNHQGTHKSIVEKVLLNMGAGIFIVDFPDMNNPVEQLPQLENDFSFLVTLSRRFMCHFRLSYNTAGVLCAAFCSADKLAKFAEMVGGAGAIKLSYGFLDNKDTLLGLIPNVISYSWNYNPTGGAGQGATTTVGPDGIPQLTRYIIENESVQTWKLNTEKCQRRAADLAADPEGLNKFWNNVLAPNVGWETAREYYDRDNQNTASETFGYKISCEVQGDPKVVSGSMIFFGKGFPDMFGARDRTWWARSVRHEFSNQGYKTNIEIVDSLQMLDGGISLPEAVNYALEDAKRQ